MPVIYRASAGYLWRHPWQLGLAILGICIGVAVMVAVDLANQSSRKAFVMSMDTLNGQATHQIVAGPGGVDEVVYRRLRVARGMRNIAPVVTGYVTAGGQTLQLLGVDVFAERSFRQFSAPENIEADIAGRGPGGAERVVRQLLTGDAAVIMSPALAAALAPDGQFELVANGKQYSARPVATVGSDAAGMSDRLLVADIAVAQRWLGMRGKLSRIDLRLDGADPAIVEQVRALLPAGTEILPAAGRTRATADMSKAFMTNLTAMSLLALLVGIFLIYNSVAFAVLQRRRLIGILRALGLTRRQTVTLILGEAAAIGAVGATLGVLGGIWLGEKLLSLVAQTVSDHYFVVNVTDVIVDPVSVLKGLLAGFGATLVAAAVPAIEASGYRPRLAMTRSSIEQSTSSVVPRLAIAGTGLMVIAGSLVVFSGASLVAGLGALFLLIFGFALIIPLLVRLLSRPLSTLAGRLGGAAARMAIGGVDKTLSRTGVAIVALAIAVSATIGVSVMVGSFRVSVGTWLDNTLQADVYVGVARGSLDPDLIADIVQAAGVARYSTSRRAWLESAYGRTRVVAVETAPGSHAGTTLRHADPEQAWAQFDNESAVLVSDSFAYRQSLAAGDRITLNTRHGPTTLAIAAIYQSYDANNGAVMMSRKTWDRFFDDPGVDSLGLYLHAGTDPVAVMDEIQAISDGRQALIMNSNARIREISLAIFDRTFVITNVLYWLAVGVAIIGIFGAMLALQLERGREFGMLRALGMTPLQTGALVALQTGYVGLLAGLLAVPLGLLMGWVLLAVINRRAFGWQIELAATPGPLGWAIVLAAGAALLAGIYPAWQAARVRPALAMREE